MMTFSFAHMLTQPIRPAMRLVATMTVVVGLAGCSSLQLAYSFADDVVDDRVSDYLLLDEEREEDLSRQIDAFFAWHRAEMMSKYAGFFTAQADIVDAGGWTRPQLAAAFGEFRVLVDETVKGATPFVAKVLLDHTEPQNLRYLENRMTEQLAERREDEAAETAEESVDEWVERRVDQMERFTGELNDTQIAIIRRYSEDRMDNGLRWLDNREQRQIALLDFLRTNPDQQETERFIHQLLLRAHELVDPDYKAITDRRWSMREEMYFEVLNAMDADQRAQLSENLRDYAADMRDIAGV